MGKAKLLGLVVISTHSRAKAAGCRCGRLNAIPGFQLTAARRRLARRSFGFWTEQVFQLTAARRRLDGS